MRERDLERLDHLVNRHLEHLSPKPPEMPDNPTFEPARHSSLRTAVAQMEDLALSQPATPGSAMHSSHHSSSTPSLSGLNDALEEHALKQENGESLVQSPGTRAREGSDASNDGEKGNTFFGATTPLCVLLVSLAACRRPALAVNISGS